MWTLQQPLALSSYMPTCTNTHFIPCAASRSSILCQGDRCQLVAHVHDCVVVAVNHRVMMQICRAYRSITCKASAKVVIPYLLQNVGAGCLCRRDTYASPSQRLLVYRRTCADSASTSWYCQSMCASHIHHLANHPWCTANFTLVQMQAHVHDVYETRTRLSGCTRCKHCLQQCCHVIRCSKLDAMTALR